MIGDAPVCSLQPLISIDDFRESFTGNGPPPLVEGYTSIDAVNPSLHNDDIGFTWDSDNQAIVVTVNSTDVSKIVAADSRGYSIYTLKEGPWGAPWNNGESC